MSIPCFCGGLDCAGTAYNRDEMIAVYLHELGDEPSPGVAEEIILLWSQILEYGDHYCPGAEEILFSSEIAIEMITHVPFWYLTMHVAKLELV